MVSEKKCDPDGRVLAWLPGDLGSKNPGSAPDFQGVKV